MVEFTVESDRSGEMRFVGLRFWRPAARLFASWQMRRKRRLSHEDKSHVKSPCDVAG